MFMAGSGTCCPTLDFKPLWSLLTKRHRIVVIEKVTQLGEVTLTGHIVQIESQVTEQNVVVNNKKKWIEFRSSLNLYPF